MNDATLCPDCACLRMKAGTGGLDPRGKDAHLTTAACDDCGDTREGSRYDMIIHDETERPPDPRLKDRPWIARMARRERKLAAEETRA